jgi:hypothetical protein
MYACKHEQLCLYKHICVCVCVCIRILMSRISLFLGTGIHVYMHVCIHALACVCLCYQELSIHVRMCEYLQMEYVCAYVCKCVHTRYPERV